eukprot:m.478141 g.478141  ORF g.478141 m.478141 type:complete len:194 (+) comp57166_c0_seq2:1-582(+)
MIGFALGLGDRHPFNILVDLKTAEFIHIDLGLAFDQGRLLKVPEMIPFRLTRDVVDGFGPMGIEGAFRTCSEKTLSVLRESKESLLTILEVFLYDPLYDWSVTSKKALKLQAQDDDLATPSGAIRRPDRADDGTDSLGKNKEALRVLYKTRQKLQGIVDGSLLSVAGHVNHLIQEATNEDNLARLFPGWQPYV